MKMRARIKHKDGSYTMGYASSLNTSSVEEILMQFDTGDADSVYIRELEVLIGDEWVPLREAMSGPPYRAITDNYNTRIFEPADDQERQRGWRE